jgi:ATP-binding cassette subfamily C protein LapB
MSTIVDLPFFFCLSWCWHLSPAAGLDCPGRRAADDPGRAAVAKSWRCSPTSAAHEATLRNAVLVESVQGLEDIADAGGEPVSRNSGTAISVLPESPDYAPAKLTQALTGQLGVTVQILVYAAIIMFGAPGDEGTLTTGSVVAASMLGSRMIAPMANLCGVAGPLTAG